MVQMTRRGLLSVLFVAPGFTETPYDDLKEKALRVDRAWDTFIRKLFGCKPEGEMNLETCNVSLTQVDLKAFRAWEKAAKKLLEN
jgi:hypothetical protein